MRRSLKADLAAKAEIRNVSHMKVITFEGGKPKEVRECHFTNATSLLLLPFNLTNTEPAKVQGVDERGSC